MLIIPNEVQAVDLITAWSAICGFFGFEFSFDLVDELESLKLDASKSGTGAMSSLEGPILYGLVRMAKPSMVLELGTFAGTSANYFCEGLLKNEIPASFLSLDKRDDDSFARVFDHSRYEKLDYLDISFRRKINAVAFFVENLNRSFDFIFEDLDHSTVTIEAVSTALSRLMPNGFLVSHDPYVVVKNYGDNVRLAFQKAGILDEAFGVQIGKSSGFLIYRKPGA